MSCAVRSEATDYNSDGSAANVQALHDVASNGDRIFIPAGTFTWSTTVTVSKAITLQGNGIGRTIIRDNVQTPGFCLRVNSPAGWVSRVTGIEFQDGGRTTITSAPNAVVKIFGNNTNRSATRIDHCKFYHLNGHVGTENAIGSVFDHCEFYFRGNTYLFAYANGYDGGTWGDKSWAAPSGLGGPNFLFVEDCLLKNDDVYYACMDAFGGARYVIRYCQLVNTHPGGHGTEGQRARGVRAVEVYNNVMAHTLGGVVGNVRGGVQIYHDNVATGPSTVGIRLQCQRVLNAFNIWGRADGTSVYDVNQNGVVVHAIDQPGRAEGGLISGGNPPALPAGWNDQVTDPCYAWNNIYDGQPTRMYGEQYNIREGEHYFNSPKPGYTPYTYPHPLVTDASPTPTPTATATFTPTPKPTATATATINPTPTATATFTPTPTATATFTPTPTATATATINPTPTATATFTPTPTATATFTPTPTATATATINPTPTATATFTPTATPTVTATPVSIPAAPTNLSATAVSSTQINLAWTDNSNNETGFKIERSRNGHGFSEIDTVDANVTIYSATRLSRGATYYFRVRAYNEAGNSAYSNVAEATTNP